MIGQDRKWRKGCTFLHPAGTWVYLLRNVHVVAVAHGFVRRARQSPTLWDSAIFAFLIVRFRPSTFESKENFT